MELVSVIIPTRNRLQLLLKAIHSVRQQTWKDIEIIVINDASTDDTASVVREMANERLIFINNQISKGGAVTRNQGIAAARGKYICFLDDDDIWMADKVERQISLFKSDSRCTLVTCSYTEICDNGKRKFVRVDANLDEQEMLYTNWLGGASMYLTTRAALEKVGGFNPRLRSGQDWDLALKLFYQGKVLSYTESLVDYLAHRQARITNSYDAVYQGHREVYFLYRDKMTSATKRRVLCELLFFRIKMSEKRSIGIFFKFIKAFMSLKLTASFIFALRLIRYIVLGR